MFSDIKVTLPFTSCKSSEDYCISLPQQRSATAIGRHLSGSMSNEDRPHSRQSTMTTSSVHSVLDTHQIHLSLQREDSRLSSSSVQTMARLSVSSKDDERDGDEEKTSLERVKNPSPDSGKSQLSSNASQSQSSSNSLIPASASTSRSGTESVWRSAAHSPTRDEPSHPSTHYIGELVWQVDELVFCGTSRAAQNLNLLCRLNIGYIIDLCGDEESDINGRYYRPRFECSCMCARKTAHSRMTMSINIKDEVDPNNPTKRIEWTDSQRQDVVIYFGDTIALIDKAHASGKCVLLHSARGRNRAPAFVAAYLMYSQRITRVQALSQVGNLISKTRPGMSVSDNFLRALNNWQNVLQIKSNEGFLTQGSASVFHIKKSAWNV